MRLARVSQAILLIMVTVTLRPGLPLANGSTQDFGTCNSLPQGWSCGGTYGQAGTVSNITNGVLETDMNATGVGGSNDYRYATSQKGTFPWSGPGTCSSASAPSNGVIPGNLTTVKSTFTASALPTNGRYHIYIALYYWLPNGSVSAGGSTYRCLDTQSRVESIGGTFTRVGSNATYDPGDSFGWDNVTLSNITVGTSYTLAANVTATCHGDYLAWGISPSTPCQLAGIEIGVEGFQCDLLKVQWSSVSTDSAIPPATKPAPSSFPILYYLFIGIAGLGVAMLGVLVFVRRKRSPTAPEQQTAT